MRWAVVGMIGLAGLGWPDRLAADPPAELVRPARGAGWITEAEFGTIFAQVRARYPLLNTPGWEERERRYRERLREAHADPELRALLARRREYFADASGPAAGQTPPPELGRRIRERESVLLRGSAGDLGAYVTQRRAFQNELETWIQRVRPSPAKGRWWQQVVNLNTQTQGGTHAPKQK